MNQHPTLDEIEIKLQSEIFPGLERARPNYDKQHTETVVYYAKKIAHLLQFDSEETTTLVIAAYAHDWGYEGMFDQNTENAQYDKVHSENKKIDHMIESAKKLTMLLNDPFFSFLSTEQKQRAIHLVKVHDNVYELKAKDEIALMEADTLGSLDYTKTKPSYDKESYRKYIENSVKKKRFPLLESEFAKNRATELLENLDTMF